MPTTNIVSTKVGTGWTIDVTAVNLDPDLTIKDFVVLIAGVVSPNSNFTKTSSTVLTYIGVSIASSSVEVRRVTPTSPVQVIAFAQRFSSTDYNKELDRISRRAEEYTLNGIGAGSIITTATPQDTVFGVAWDGNILQPPSMNAVYDKIITLANIDSPTFTGVPLAPTAATATNTTQLATTAFVQSNLASYAPLASPTFTGTPNLPTGTVVVTQAIANNTTAPASTAYVQSQRVTQAINDNSTNFATTAYVNTSNRPAFDAYEATGGQSIPHNSALGLIYNTETLDTNSAYNTSTGFFTVPTGMGGTYLFYAGLVINTPAKTLQLELWLSGAAKRRIVVFNNTTDIVQDVYGTIIVKLNAGDAVNLVAFMLSTASTARTVAASAALTVFSGVRLNTG